MQQQPTRKLSPEEHLKALPFSAAELAQALRSLEGDRWAMHKDEFDPPGFASTTHWGRGVGRMRRHLHRLHGWKPVNDRNVPLSVSPCGRHRLSLRLGRIDREGEPRIARFGPGWESSLVMNAVQGELFPEYAPAATLRLVPDASEATPAQGGAETLTLVIVARDRTARYFIGKPLSYIEDEWKTEWAWWGEVKLDESETAG